MNDRGAEAPDSEDQRFLASFFLTANEFVDLYGANPTDQQYIAAMYESVLKRELDPDGFEFWIGQMQEGLGRDDILIHFAESDENRYQTAPDLDYGVWVV